MLDLSEFVVFARYKKQNISINIQLDITWKKLKSHATLDIIGMDFERQDIFTEDSVIPLNRSQKLLIKY